MSDEYRVLKVRRLVDGELVDVFLDPEDYERLKHHAWYVNKYGYVERSTAIGGVRKNIRMHREVMGFDKGDPLLDHEDRNRLNNTKKNLRPATYAQNNQNLSTWKNKESKYRGVTFNKRVNKWKATGYHNKTATFLGLFDTEEEADAAVKDFRKNVVGFSEEAGEIEKCVWCNGTNEIDDQFTENGPVRLCVECRNDFVRRILEEG